MNRRQLLLGSAMSLLAAGVRAAEKPVAGDHAGHAASGDVLDAVAGCLAKGEACLQHCLVLLGSGDATLGECAKAVSDMLAIDGALLRLAATQSSQLRAVATVALSVNRACEAACRKHADTHAVCKACGEACARTIAAITPLAA